MENEARQLRERINAINLESERANSRTRQNEERCTELDKRAAAAQEEIAVTQQKLDALEQERDGNRAVLESAATDVSAAQQRLAEKQAEANRAAASLSQLESQQEERRRAVVLRIRTTRKARR